MLPSIIYRIKHVYKPEKECVLYVLDMVAVVREVLRRGMSINLHMFHGGTNFGFMTGAVAKPSYKALIPSYGLSSFNTSHSGKNRYIYKQT